MRTPCSIVTLLVLLLAQPLWGCSRPAPDGATPPGTATPLTPDEPPVIPQPSSAPQASSAPSAGSAQQEDHEAGWRAIVAAMQAGDRQAVKGRTTKAGYDSLMQGVDDEAPEVAFKRWGRGWGDGEIRWQSVGDADAHGKLGPEIKAHGIWLVKVGAIWKLDRWARGR